jgi:hypothetical protein
MPGSRSDWMVSLGSLVVALKNTLADHYGNYLVEPVDHAESSAMRPSRLAKGVRREDVHVIMAETLQVLLQSV